MLQEGENEGYQETVLMVKSVTTWSACIHRKDEAEGQCNVCFKGRYIRLGCCKHKGCSITSGFGLWQKSDASRQKIWKTQGISVNEN